MWQMIFPAHIRNMGYERSFLLDFVDMDASYRICYKIRWLWKHIK